MQELPRDSVVQAVFKYAVASLPVLVHKSRVDRAGKLAMLRLPVRVVAQTTSRGVRAHIVQIIGGELRRDGPPAFVIDRGAAIHVKVHN